MEMEVDVRCPQCGERVLDAESDAAGQQHPGQLRATCPHCHVELVRHRDIEDNAWEVEMPRPLSDEELGVGD
jgi:DNA-directed RNA polymerase subunit RPC12/RpoP